MPKRVTRRGLTLIEILFALAILAVLVAIAIPTFIDRRERLKIYDAIADLRTLQAALDMYRTEFGAFPDSLDQAQTGVPRDPWGNPYRYTDLANAPPGEARKDKNLVPINSDYDLYSVGEDGDSETPLTAKASRDDIIRANDGAYFGVASDY